jgi:zinc transport system ATP-binding protein
MDNAMVQHIIEIQDVTAGYGEKMALEHANLTVYDHDYLGVIGPNGGGKTTLMRILLGLKKPLSGTIKYFRNGQPVKEITMGYLPQYSSIDKAFPISVYEVVLSGLSRQKRFMRPYTIAQRQQVTDTIAHMELSGFEKRPIGALSGGQLQRVLLARAVVSRPDVIMLDEPNTYIDKRFQEQMYQMLAELNKECAIVIASHDIAETLANVKHVACVNLKLHYHQNPDIPKETLEEHFLKI